MTKFTIRTAMISCPVLIALMLLSCTRNSQEIASKDPVLHDLKHSHIVLMPEGEPDDILAYRPLSPSVVAWGNDPVGRLKDPERLRKKMDSYKELGVGLLASNVWMLTATPRVLYENPQYQDAVCLDIEGNRIVPRWLVDGNYKGVRSYWGCTNHPLFRSQLIERAVAGIAAGANMLHLDDHLGTSAAAEHSGGCFCKYCMEGFRTWLEVNFSAGELHEKGITDIGSFNYGELVRVSGFTTLESYMQGASRNEIPLRDEFLVYQRDAAADFVRQLGVIADSTAGVAVPVGVNAWNLIPTQLSTSHHADFFANEVSHMDVEDLIPPLVYMLGTALGKPVFTTGTGEDWIQVNHESYVTRVRRWIATSYAFGHYFMYSYNKWGFTEETGTKWSIIPVSTFEPICRFISDNAGLFDDYEPVTQVGVLYDNAACRNNEWGVRTVCRDLHYANIPTGLLVAGDDWMQYRMTEDQLEEFELVIVPQGSELPGDLSEATGKMEEDGRILTWTGLEDVSSRITPLVSLKNSGNVWLLPRKIPGEAGSPIVIHLLNQDYDSDSDSMLVKTGIEVFISKQLTDGAVPERVTVFEPGGDPRELEATQEDQGVTVRLPELDLWAILKVECSRPE